MLARVVSLLTGTTPPSSQFASSSGVLTVWQTDVGYMVESSGSLLKAQNVQLIIDAAKKAGATVRWLD